MSASAPRQRPRFTTVSEAAAAAPQPRGAARMVTLEPGLYAVSVADEKRPRQRAAGVGLHAVHLCVPPQLAAAVTITDSVGGAGGWLGGRRTMLFVAAPAGGAVLATAYVAGNPESDPLELEFRRLDAARAAAPPARLRLTLGDAAAAPPTPQPVSVEIVAHIRGRGDVRFVDAPWIGRLERGAWIEALTIRPRDASAAAAIEYKGLNASGAETPWLAAGSLCGTRGEGTPLIGFAVRQKVAAGALFDCEYSGFFQSGTIVGPCRNGAPCRSALADDPLEGLQLRITLR
jgi:hypothetical protein